MVSYSKLLYEVFLLYLIFNATLVLNTSYAYTDRVDQSGGSLVTIKFGETVVTNFSTYYTGTKVILDIRLDNEENKVNITIFDSYNYNQYLKGINTSNYLKVINAMNETEYKVTLGEMGRYFVVAENNILEQEIIGVGIFVYYNDDPLFNPGTIPIFIILFFILIGISISGFILIKRYR